MNRKWIPRIAGPLLIALALPILAAGASAHHVLGRPAYSLNEDSNTPPAMQGESQIGDYFVTYMIYPAFPKPGEPGRINLYIKHRDTNQSYQGKVTFMTRNDSWLSKIGLDNESENLGVQPNDANVYRQGYVYHETGDYLVSAQFGAGDDAHVLEFPLRVGAPSMLGPIGMVIGALAIFLFFTNLFFRRRAMSVKLRQAHDKEA
ncbi:MAG: hypothetical protein HQ503_14505 [Rhodospirillales bacterium]|nr:hypothetical protein [Rhodospirillales bacterium]